MGSYDYTPQTRYHLTTLVTASGKTTEWSMSSGIAGLHQDLVYLQVSPVLRLPAYPTQLINIKRMIIKN